MEEPAPPDRSGVEGEPIGVAPPDRDPPAGTATSADRAAQPAAAEQAIGGTNPAGAATLDEPPPFLDRRQSGRRLRPPTPRVGLLILATMLVAVILYLGRDALSPFIVGLLLVYLLDPPVESLRRLYVPGWLAVLIVYGIALLLLVEIMSLTLTPLVRQVSDFASDLPRLSRALEDQLHHLSETYRGLDLPPEIRSAIDNILNEISTRTNSIDVGVLLPVFSSLAGFVATLFGYLIVPVWVFYLLKDRRQLTEAFDRALPEEWRLDVWAVIRIGERVFGQWVKAQLVLGVSVAVATYIGLVLLGAWVDPLFGRFALLLALIAGLFELLPIIGPILSAIPALLLAATISVQAVVPVFILYAVIQQLENNLLVPKIQGDAVRLHPSAVMFALVIGGAIGGLLGAILAVPVTAAGRDVYRYLFNRLSPIPATPREAAEAALGLVTGGQLTDLPDLPPVRASLARPSEPNG